MKPAIKFFTEPAIFMAILLLVPMLSSASSAFAQSCSKQSPAHTLALLELYTSEGCSSCPPADQFVSRFRNVSTAPAGLTADQVVPLALHVDYWDYIGWKDLFGKPAFTQRQRWLSELAASRTIYTPEIFIGGAELRKWRDDVPATVKRINQKPARANIGISMGKVSHGKLAVEVNATSAQAGRLYVALYENGLLSEVRAGENRGESLKHDYTVREWSAPIALSGGVEGGKATMTRTFAVPAGWIGKNLGVAAFVQTDKGDVLQALALPLCGGG